ncbi:ArsR/SmtB family transcription factor [Inediibacterium massiliense]|uniref:ArsR/SmtB family transcription factor n=1 Tax=Inediibacterium massiliense TaxID=1658111 RepID=UPI0006B4975C|nr:metalloregulator ArsR/SmtB family transcription factor [Inediibacterium massiliense]
MDINNMQVKVLKALAHPTRLKIVKKLLKGTLCVCELNEDIDFSQSNLSQHLKILKEANILMQEKDGLRVNYSIKSEEVVQLIDIVEKIVEKEIKNLTKQIRGD